MKRGFRQAIMSTAVFVAILVALVSVDPRVHDRFRDLLYGGDGLSPWGDRMGDLVGALAGAIRHQSIENAPLLVFAVAGGVLFVFMVRT
jgi:hypothetical protein